MHLWGILAHLGLVVAVAINYIYDLDKATRSITWSHSAAAEMNSGPCRLALAAASSDGFTFDKSTHALLKACLVVVSSYGTVTNPTKSQTLLMLFFLLSLRGPSGSRSTSSTLPYCSPSSQTELV